MKETLAVGELFVCVCVYMYACEVFREQLVICYVIKSKQNKDMDYFTFLGGKMPAVGMRSCDFISGEALNPQVQHNGFFSSQFLLDICKPRI